MSDVKTQPAVVLRQRLIACAVLVAIAGWLTFVGAMRPSEHPGWFHCPTDRYLGVPCAGCGATRATHALLHGDVAAALRFNPMVMLLGIPALAYVAYTQVRVLAGRPVAADWPRFALLGWVVLGLVLAFWGARLIPVEALDWLRPPR